MGTLSVSSELIRNTLWDLLLGVIPALLGWGLAAGVARTPRRLGWLWLPAGLVWLLFLPNAPYLLTEMRHYFRREPVMVWDDAGATRFLLISGFYLAFSGSGLLLFALAVRPIHRLARERRWPVPFLAPALFLLCSLGVYLGLRLRFNSWDLWKAPQEVLVSAWDALTVYRRAGPLIVGFAGVLWAAYVAVDIWIDGLLLRLGRRKTQGRKA
ncbi:MAG TPA: DUF1361 domain-containing protein [Armatimonadota bacterium]|nr:DUF1361 domain-containing protein [Armatimonadota bacterium]